MTPSHPFRTNGPFWKLIPSPFKEDTRRRVVALDGEGDAVLDREGEVETSFLIEDIKNLIDTSNNIHKIIVQNSKLPCDSRVFYSLLCVLLHKDSIVHVLDGDAAKLICLLQCLLFLCSHETTSANDQEEKETLWETQGWSSNFNALVRNVPGKTLEMAKKLTAECCSPESIKKRKNHIIIVSRLAVSPNDILALYSVIRRLHQKTSSLRIKVSIERLVVLCEKQEPHLHDYLRFLEQISSWNTEEVSSPLLSEGNAPVQDESQKDNGDMSEEPVRDAESIPRTSERVRSVCSTPKRKGISNSTCSSQKLGRGEGKGGIKRQNKGEDSEDNRGEEERVDERKINSERVYEKEESSQEDLGPQGMKVTVVVARSRSKKRKNAFEAHQHECQVMCFENCRDTFNYRSPLRSILSLTYLVEYPRSLPVIVPGPGLRELNLLVNERALFDGLEDFWEDGARKEERRGQEGKGEEAKGREGKTESELWILEAMEERAREEANIQEDVERFTREVGDVQWVGKKEEEEGEERRGEDKGREEEGSKERKKVSLERKLRVLQNFGAKNFFHPHHSKSNTTSNFDWIHTIENLQYFRIASKRHFMGGGVGEEKRRKRDSQRGICGESQMLMNFFFHELLTSWGKIASASGTASLSCSSMLVPYFDEVKSPLHQLFAEEKCLIELFDASFPLKKFTAAIKGDQSPEKKKPRKSTEKLCKKLAFEGVDIAEIELCMLSLKQEKATLEAQRKERKKREKQSEGRHEEEHGSALKQKKEQKEARSNDEQTREDAHYLELVEESQMSNGRNEREVVIDLTTPEGKSLMQLHFQDDLSLLSSSSFMGGIKKLKRDVSSTSTQASSSDLKGNKNSCRFLWIFDWDNTLFPTSVIEKLMERGENKNLIHQRLKQYFDDLKRSIIKLFLYVKNFGSIVIVSNASKSWIDQCLDAYLPDIRTIFSLLGVMIVSSLEYASRFIPADEDLDDPEKLMKVFCKWKQRTFKECLRLFVEAEKSIQGGEVQERGVGCVEDRETSVWETPKKRRSPVPPSGPIFVLVSIGDAEFEREACISLNTVLEEPVKNSLLSSLRKKRRHSERALWETPKTIYSIIDSSPVRTVSIKTIAQPSLLQLLHMHQYLKHLVYQTTLQAARSLESQDLKIHIKNPKSTL